MQCKILVVDDDFTIRHTFSEILKKEGFHVEVVDSGLNALKLLEKEKFDLVFLDLKMQNLSGVDTLRLLRDIDSSVPVYIVTGFYDFYMDELRSISKEGLDFELLSKPVTKEQLVSVSNSVLSGSYSC